MIKNKKWNKIIKSKEKKNKSKCNSQKIMHNNSNKDRNNKRIKMN